MDTADRDRLEQELQQRAQQSAEAEERMRSVVNHVVDGIITIDERGTVTTFNSAAERIFRYAAHEVIGQNIKMLMPEPYHSQHDGYVADYLRTGQAKIIGIGREVVGRRKNGSTFPMDLAISVFRLGTDRCFTGIVRDITERKRAASELRFLNDVVTQSTQPFAMADLEGRILRANRAFERLTGYSEQELQQLTYQQLTPERWHDMEKTHVAALKAGQAARFEKEYQRKDGTIVPIDVVLDVRQTAPGEPNLLCKFVTDISERKLAEQALRASDERYRKLFEHAPDGIVIADPDSYYLDVNASLCRMLGYSREELIGLHAAEIVAEEEIKEIEPALNAIKSKAGYHREWRFRRKDGSVFAAEVIATLMPDGNLMGMIRDVTERKRAESEVRKAVEELARSNLDLEQFAYVASHDLQEPLRAVAGCVQILKKRYQEKLDSRADELITHAVDGVSRMQTLINDLLAYSRVGTRGKEFAPNDCNVLLDQALANLETAVTEAGAVVSRDPLPVVNADAVQLTQLFQNLVSNAIKFRGEQPPKIHVGARHEEGHWLFSVKDNGIGMQPEYFERIFVIFQRLHTRSEYPGTGIGLAICKKIVERHGGRIFVESTPGQGSTFFFTLPDKGVK